MKMPSLAQRISSRRAEGRKRRLQSSARQCGSPTLAYRIIDAGALGMMLQHQLVQRRINEMSMLLWPPRPASSVAPAALN